MYKTHVFSNSVGVVDAVDALGHEHRLLLVGHGVAVVARDVAQARHHAQALRDLAVHGAVHVVQQVERLRDQLVPLRHRSRLDLVLSSRVEVVRVRCLKFLFSNYASLFFVFIP